MIRVKRILSEEELCGLEIKGHANSDEHGKDLVCAAVSSIITGGFNALDRGEIEEITLKEGYAKVVINNHADYSKLVLKVIEIQLLTIEEGYPQYINIK
jgi:uncharacterized protein YsxB (DUF464 family)